MNERKLKSSRPSSSRDRFPYHPTLKFTSRKQKNYGIYTSILLSTPSGKKVVKFKFEAEA